MLDGDEHHTVYRQDSVLSISDVEREMHLKRRSSLGRFKSSRGVVSTPKPKQSGRAGGGGVDGCC